ncbi:hypothetical protein F5X99DRAFT_385391 [Biscogniauxia marginata]|nr:hypothetical protein F5X99DRAFT_385391 [Biscogniauxia marginata]
MLTRATRSGLRRAGAGIHPSPRTTRTSGVRSYASDGEPPRSQSPPASGGKVGDNSSMAMIGGIGLTVGAVFLYMMAQPEKAKDVSNFGGDQGGHNQGSNVLKQGSSGGSRTPGQRAA